MVSIPESPLTLPPAYQVMQSRGSELAWLLKVLVRQPAAAVATWRQRARERRELATMDAHMLHDLGLSLADVRREVNKHGWQA